MEIGFENKTVNAYREVFRQVKRVQESAESVVPDVNDDIGRIASVQSSVLLKSKELSSRGVLVTGEAGATLLYITENGGAVSSVRLSKSFEMEFETGDLGPEAAAQVSLTVSNAEARVLNPRKVSVTLEIAGDLSCYRPETVPVETAAPQQAGDGLHARYETAEAVIANAVCEKTFAINEQYVFPSGKPAPSQLVFQRVDYRVAETQSIGSKVIVKGSVNVSVCYLSQEVNYPLRTEFSSPFSQIVDIGQEDTAGCSVQIELTSAYYDLIDTINGEKAMDAELHAVAQVVSRRRQSVRYVSDAYSNLMPARCTTESGQIGTAAEPMRATLLADERVNVSEDCEDVLCVFASLSPVTASQMKLSASATLDVVYRSRSGSLECAKRLVSLEGESTAVPSRIGPARLTDLYLRPDGPAIDCRATAEAVCQCSASAELVRVVSVELDEEAAYDLGQLPTVTLVRVGEESLWELAKSYHSSVERIQAANDLSEGLAGRLLLIPKEI